MRNRTEKVEENTAYFFTLPKVLFMYPHVCTTREFPNYLKPGITCDMLY